jgi:hypothetical protein
MKLVGLPRVQRILVLKYQSLLYIEMAEVRDVIEQVMKVKMDVSLTENWIV